MQHDLSRVTLPQCKSTKGERWWCVTMFKPRHGFIFRQIDDHDKLMFYHKKIKPCYLQDVDTNTYIKLIQHFICIIFIINSTTLKSTTLLGLLPYLCLHFSTQTPLLSNRFISIIHRLYYQWYGSRQTDSQ